MTIVSSQLDEALVQECIVRLGDRDAAQRVQAAMELALLGRQAVAAVPALTQALADSSPAVRRAAALALGEIGPDARMAVLALAKALNDVEEVVRRRAAVALGEIGPDARPAVPALVRALEDPCEAVWRWVVAALGEIGPAASAAIGRLIELLALDQGRDRAIVMSALLRMGQRAIARLAMALQHTDPRIRMQAARALQKAGAPAEALPALEALLDDPNPMVREVAAEALEPRR